ncbi:MAG TPA: hypothetical protein VL424_19395 [Pararobbsia sp.]|nr:hypothetical protein [Pararobbsia sp.]
MWTFSSRDRHRNAAQPLGERFLGPGTDAGDRLHAARAPRALRRAGAARTDGMMMAGRASPRLAQAAVLAVWLWSMVELPAELTIDASIVQTFALALSKICLTLLAYAVLLGKGYARKIFLFVCWLSILAIAPDLPLQFRIDRTGFYLSAIECVLKGLTIVAFALPSLEYKVRFDDPAHANARR